MRLIVPILLLSIIPLGPATAEPNLGFSFSPSAFQWEGAIQPEPGTSFAAFIVLEEYPGEFDRFAFRLDVPRSLSVISFTAASNVYLVVSTDVLDAHRSRYDVSGRVPFNGCAGGTDPVVLVEVEMAMPVLELFQYMLLTGLKYYDDLPVVSPCQGEMEAVECGFCYASIYPHVPIQASSWGSIKALF